jgi:hypothetical protein
MENLNILKNTNLKSPSKVFGVLVFVYVIMNIYFFGMDPKYAKLFGIILFGLAFIDSGLLKEKAIYLNKAVVFYGFFTLWGVLSLFWAMNLPAYYDYQRKIILCAITVFFLYHIIRWYKVKNYFFWGIIAGGFLNFLIFLGLFPYPEADKLVQRFSGTIGNPNGLANLMVFSLFAASLLLNFFTKNKILKWLLFLNIPLTLVMIIQTGSRKGISLAVVFLFIFSFHFFKSIKGIVTVMIAVLVIFTVFTYLSNNADFKEQLEYAFGRFENMWEEIEGTNVDKSAEMRISLFKEGSKIHKLRPFLGAGLNNSVYVLGGAVVHSNFGEIIVTLGPLGFFFYYMFYFYSIKNVLGIKDKTLKISLFYFLVAFLIADLAWNPYSDIIFLSMMATINAICAEFT